MSHKLRELELRLECDLFIRKSRPLRFSEADKLLLLLADDVIAKVSEAERDVKNQFMVKLAVYLWRSNATSALTG